MGASLPHRVPSPDRTRAGSRGELDGTVGDAVALDHAVADLVRRTRFPVAFGGLAVDDEIRVTSIHGARTHNLQGLVVKASRGLGGRALVEKRPRLALDYRSSRSITHDYDRAVLGEGIATLFAVPVLVSGRARGVIYCGSWAESPVGDVVARPAFTVAEELSSELRIRDEVQRRLALSPRPLKVIRTAMTAWSGRQRSPVPTAWPRRRPAGAPRSRRMGLPPRAGHLRTSSGSSSRRSGRPGRTRSGRGVAGQVRRASGTRRRLVRIRSSVHCS